MCIRDSHHCVYPLFYYQLGAYTTAAGATITGDNNIYFAQMADGITPTSGLGGYGSYILCLCILPSILLAVYKCAKREKKKEVKSICMSAGITAVSYTHLSKRREDGRNLPMCWLYAKMLLRKRLRGR